MTLDKEDLKEIGELMDKRMLYFHEVVTIPGMDNVVEKLRSDLGLKIDGLQEDMDQRMTSMEHNMSRIERKIDGISDYHSQELADHRKRIEKLEAFMPA